MTLILRLQIKQLSNAVIEDKESIEPIAPTYLLNDSLDLCCHDGQFYLLQADQKLPLQAGDTIGNEDFIFSVQLQNEEVIDVVPENAASEIVPHDTVISEAAFALAELNREDTQLELDTLMQAYGNDDPLAFLFATKPVNADISVFSNKKDPLALLNEHFQPPQATMVTEAITVMQPAEIFPLNEFNAVEGNILRDLGFLAETPYHDHKSMSLLQMSLSSTTHIGYRDEIE